MNKFIGMIILKPDIDKGELDFVQSNIINLFEQNSKVEKIWYLGKNQLDYKIKEYIEGFYLKIELLAKPKKLEEIREILKFNSNIIFSMIINDDTVNNKLPILKKQYSLPYIKNSIVNKLETNQPRKKI